MAEQTISDAVQFPQDEGVASITDGNETWDSAGHLMALSQAVDSDSYVRSDTELTFSGHDATNDTVDVTAGIAYLSLDGETVDVQGSVGGDTPPAYDTTLPTLPAIAVVVPTTVSGVALQDSTASDVWLAYDTDGTGPGSVGSVYIRSDDTGSVTAPGHPSVKLGSANPDDSASDVIENRHGSPTLDTITDGSSGNEYSPDDLASKPVGGPSTPWDLTRVPSGGSRGNYGWGSITYHDGTLYAIYRDGDSHSYDGSSSVRYAESTDSGLTWQNDTDISDGTGDDLRPRNLTTLDNGRIAALADNRTGSSSFGSPVFIHSDDGGSTWTLTTVSVTATSPRAITNIVRYPSSVGGDDDGGWVAFPGDQGDFSIRALTTTDNGDTWTDAGEIISADASVDYSEPYVARLGNRDQWAMVLRDNSGESTDAQITKSTDLTTWDTPTTSGQVLGRNRPTLWYESGAFHLLAATRSWTSHEIGSYGDGLLLQSVGADDLWDDLTAWGGWLKILDGRNPDGYADVATIGQETLLSFAVDGTSSNTDLGLLRPEGVDQQQETYIEAYLGTTVSGASSGTGTNIGDTEVADTLGEFDPSTGEIGVEETGKYAIEAMAKVDPGGDGDRILLRLRNTTDGSNTFDIEMRGNTTNNQTVFLVGTVTLDASKTYEIQVVDATSSYDVVGDSSATRLTIKRSRPRP